MTAPPGEGMTFLKIQFVAPLSNPLFRLHTVRGRRLKTSPKALNLHTRTKYNTRSHFIYFIKQLYVLKLIYLSMEIFSSIFHTNSYIALGLPVAKISKESN